MRLVALALLLMPAAVHADTGVLLNIGYNGGGDRLADVHFVDGTTQTLRAGNGYAANLGFVHHYENTPLALQGSFGYLVDETTATNSRARFSRYPLELLLFWRNGGHRLGGGVTRHLSPTLDMDNLGGRVDLDAGSGFIVEYGYRAFSIRYTELDYGFEGNDVSGSGFGLYFGLGY